MVYTDAWIIDEQNHQTEICGILWPRITRRRKNIQRKSREAERILDITKAYLENPDKQVTLDMNHAFYEYAKRCIAHFYTF